LSDVFVDVLRGLETVAAMTNRPEGAVKLLQHRALRNLATALGIAGGDAT
jgi:DNA-directed RNA polymerase specialized sigma24 family protein